MTGNLEKFKLVPPFFTPNCDNVPKGRSGHSMCADETDLYVYGGYSQANDTYGVTENTVFPELWRFNFAQQKWTQFNITNTPSTCLSSCMTLQNGKLFLFGGTGYPFAEQKNRTLRIFELPKSSLNKHASASGDGNDKPEYKWTVIKTSTETAEHDFDDPLIPPPDYGQSMILHGKDIYIFGGTAGFFQDDAVAELYCLCLETLKWRRLQPTGVAPCGRYKQEVIQDSQYFYVFGGGRLLHSEGLDDIYRYSFVDNHWSKVISLPDPVKGFPKSRCSFGCVKDQDNIYISGGRHYIAINAFQELADIWHFRLSTFQWTCLSFNLPEKIFFHRTVTSPAGSMYLFGGVVEDGSRTANLYKLRLPFSLPRLTELCWETVCELLNANKSMNYDTLESIGVPWNFMERVGALPA